jgi:hypothetical protein
MIRGISAAAAALLVHVPASAEVLIDSITETVALDENANLFFYNLPHKFVGAGSYRHVIEFDAIGSATLIHVINFHFDDYCYTSAAKTDAVQCGGNDNRLETVAFTSTEKQIELNFIVEPSGQAEGAPGVLGPFGGYTIFEGDDEGSVFDFLGSAPLASITYTSKIFRTDIAPVPEPATWAMMIGGFALAGTAARRRMHGTAAQA